jgi:recombination protein RecA
MAKTKKDAQLVDDELSNFDISYISGEEFKTQKLQIIPIAPALNFALGGGIAEGSWVIFSGIPKGGKTSTALHFSANAQKPEFGNRNVFYIDAEGRLKDLNLSGIVGLDLKKFFVVRSSPGKILSAEDFLNEGVKIVTNNPGCILIIDSTSALCAEKELIGDIKADGRISGPKLLAQFCRKLGGIVPINKCVILVIQHMIANTSGYGPPLIEDGGNKILFQADYKIRCKSFHPWTGSSEESIVGQLIDWQVITSGLGGIPGYKTQSYFRYGLGLDVVMELIDLGLKINLIKKSGAWFEFDGNKYHGQLKLWDYLTQNIDVQKKLGLQINQALNMPIYNAVS